MCWVVSNITLDWPDAPSDAAPGNSTQTVFNVLLKHVTVRREPDLLICLNGDDLEEHNRSDLKLSK